MFDAAGIDAYSFMWGVISLGIVLLVGLWISALVDADDFHD